MAEANTIHRDHATLVLRALLTTPRTSWQIGPRGWLKFRMQREGGTCPESCHLGTTRSLQINGRGWREDDGYPWLESIRKLECVTRNGNIHLRAFDGREDKGKPQVPSVMMIRGPLCMSRRAGRGFRPGQVRYRRMDRRIVLVMDQIARL
jgi:hypothetical protein